MPNGFPHSRINAAPQDIHERNQSLRRAFIKWNVLVRASATPSPERESLATAIDDLATPFIEGSVRKLDNLIGLSGAVDADDAHQVALGGILDAIPRYDPAKAQPSTYCTQVANNRIVSLLRGAGALGDKFYKVEASLNTPIGEDSREDKIDALASESPTPEELVVAAEHEAFSKAKLAPTLGRVVHICGLTDIEFAVLLEGLDHLEASDTNFTDFPIQLIAKNLGISVKSAENARQRVFKKIAGHYISSHRLAPFAA